MEKKEMGEGTKTPLPESVQILLSATPTPFEHLTGRFSAVSEQNIAELSAMIDINFRVNYPHPDPDRLQTFVQRIERGELPSALVLET